MAETHVKSTNIKTLYVNGKEYSKAYLNSILVFQKQSMIIKYISIEQPTVQVINCSSESDFKTQLSNICNNNTNIELELIVPEGDQLSRYSSERLFYNLTYENRFLNINVSNYNTSNLISTAFMFAYLDNVRNISGLSNFNLNNVTNMTRMFEACKNITSLDVANWNISNVKYLWSIFDKCYNLRDIDVSNWNTSNVTQMDQVFYYCNNLQTVNVSNWNTSNVTTMVGMFNGCRNLKNVDISNWDTSKVTDFDTFFYGCYNLQSFGNISNWNVSNVRYFNSMFEYCYPIADELNLSNWNTSNVRCAESMFYSMRNVPKIDVNNWNTINLINIRFMFGQCYNIKNLNLSKWDTSKITDMTGVFSGCSNLIDLDVNNWNTENVLRINNIINGCVNLTTNSLNSFSNMVPIYNSQRFNDNSIVYLGITNSNVVNNILPNAKNILINKGWNPIVLNGNYRYSIQSGNSGWGGGSFYTQASLKSIIESRKSLSYANFYLQANEYTGGLTDLAYLCANGKYFNCINFTNLYTNNVTNVACLFDNCSNLRDIEVGSNYQNIWDMSKVTNAYHMFGNCYNLYDSYWGLYNMANIAPNYSSVFPTNDVSYLGITPKTAANQYYDWYSWKNTLENKGWNVDALKGTVIFNSPQLNTTNKFIRFIDVRNFLNTLNCNSYTNVKLTFQSSFPTGAYIDVSSCLGSNRFWWKITDVDISGLDTTVIWETQGAFRDMRYLQNVNIVNLNTSNAWCISTMFLQCYNLKSVDMSNFNLKNCQVADSVFQSCSNLTSLKVDNWDLAKMETGSYNNGISGMFAYCRNLKTLNLSTWKNQNKLTNFCELFHGCNNLVDLNIAGWDFTNATNLYGAFGGCNKLSSDSWNMIANALPIYNSERFVYAGYLNQDMTNKKTNNYITGYLSGYDNTNGWNRDINNQIILVISNMSAYAKQKIESKGWIAA